MNLQDLINQLSASNNPGMMALNMMPNQNLKNIFSNIMNSSSDQEKAQKIADYCNQNGITKQQLQTLWSQKWF